MRGSIGSTQTTRPPTVEIVHEDLPEDSWTATLLDFARPLLATWMVARGDPEPAEAEWLLSLAANAWNASFDRDEHGEPRITTGGWGDRNSFVTRLTRLLGLRRLAEHPDASALFGAVRVDGKPGRYSISVDVIHPGAPVGEMAERAA